ncbi:MAG: MutS-related protein [Chitinophagaceae bacterium]
MQVDKTTLQDLSIFHAEEEQSVFHKLNFTQTNGGRDYLRYLLATPLSKIEEIHETQIAIQSIQEVIPLFPKTITNGTIMVIDKFYETPVDAYPSNPNLLNSFLYRIFSAPDYSITKYSVEHFISFTKDMASLSQILQNTQSNYLQSWGKSIELLLKKQKIQSLIAKEKKEKLLQHEVINIGAFLRIHFKKETFELLDIYCKLDAYISLATACKEYQLSFPTLQLTQQPFVEAAEMYHLLLQTPVSYDVSLNKTTNFLFLTGANMAGKSTFIKSIGIAIYLAHIGMGVPAKSMQLSLFNGLLSNIQVADNIIKGESYFFNEVQRIKGTIERISDGKNWLILIDELFKGTNVQDAMNCSVAVIEGLRKLPNALFVLSTHLYEIGQGLSRHSNIDFRYFETNVADDQLLFSYQLKKGISNDRLGYLILKREGVVDMLEKL